MRCNVREKSTLFDAPRGKRGAKQAVVYYSLVRRGDLPLSKGKTFVPFKVASSKCTSPGRFTPTPLTPEEWSLLVSKRTSALKSDEDVLWMKKMLWLTKTVPKGDGKCWINIGCWRSGRVNPTRKVIHHGLDWTPVLSTVPTQNPCERYWSTVGTHIRTVV